MRNIIVIGGSGYIGSECVTQLLDAGYRVVNIDMTQNQHLTFVKDLYMILQDMKDQLNAESMKALNRFLHGDPVDAVICFAAYKDLPNSLETPFEYYQNNFQVLLNSLQLANSVRAKRFIFSSSAGVYADGCVGAVKETDSTTAESPYGYTKLVGERIVIDCCHQFGILPICLRYFNPIGKTETSSDDSDSLFGSIKRCIETKQVAHIFGNQYDTPDGTCIRDYVDVRDVVRAHVMLVNHPDVEYINRVKIINIGTGTGYSVLEVMKTVKELVPDFQYDIANARPGDSAGAYADISRAKILGIEPMRSLSDSIKTLL